MGNAISKKKQKAIAAMVSAYGIYTVYADQQTQMIINSKDGDLVTLSKEYRDNEALKRSYAEQAVFWADEAGLDRDTVSRANYYLEINPEA